MSRLPLLGAGGAPAAVGPVQRLWLKADSESYADNDPVGTATDRSGLGNHGTQGTAGNKPIFKTNLLNSLPGYRFDGSDDFLAFSDLMSGALAGEMFIVIKLDADPPGTSPPTGAWAFGSDAGAATHLPFTDGVIYDGWGTTARKTTVNPTPSLASQFRLYNVTSKPGEWTSRLDGTQIFTTATNTVGFNSAPTLGRSSGGGNYHLDGDVPELVVYSGELSAGERDTEEARIAAKYALTIA